MSPICQASRQYKALKSFHYIFLILLRQYYFAFETVNDIIMFKDEEARKRFIKSLKASLK